MKSLGNLAWSVALAGCLIVTGCSAVATKTNTLSDERILSETGGTLGISPSDLTLVDRRTEGVNTYVTVKTKDGKTFACTVNGGNLFSFGMTNPPICTAR